MKYFRLMLACLIILGLAVLANAQEKKGTDKKGMMMDMPKDRSMVMSKYDFNQTVSTIKKAIEDQDLMILREIDHQAMLKMVGVETKGMLTVEFFHPRYGKVIRENNRMAGIEPPLKIVIMEQDDGKVGIQWRKPSVIFGAYKGLEKLGADLDKLCDDITATCAMKM